MHHKHFLTYIPPPTVNTHIFDVPKVVETFHITLHILQPFILVDANHNNRCLVDILHLLQTSRLVDIFHNSLCMFLLLVDTLHPQAIIDIFHNNLFFLLVGTLRVTMVRNTLHNNLCPFLDTLHLVQVPMVVDTFL